MHRRVLNEDWSEYDNRKIRDGRDLAFFSCEESWEVDFLIRQIRKHKPQVSDADVKSAISYCCRSIPGNKPRNAFVECVMDRLGS
jgi:hypothetical protein